MGGVDHAHVAAGAISLLATLLLVALVLALQWTVGFDLEAITGADSVTSFANFWLVVYTAVYFALWWSGGHQLHESAIALIGTLSVIVALHALGQFAEFRALGTLLALPFWARFWAVLLAFFVVLSPVFWWLRR